MSEHEDIISALIIEKAGDRWLGDDQGGIRDLARRAEKAEADNARLTDTVALSLIQARDLALERDRLEAHVVELEGALDDIAGGYGRFEKLPDIMTLTAEEFRSQMWSWSQRCARQALDRLPGGHDEQTSEARTDAADEGRG